MNRVKGCAHAVPIEEQKKLLAMKSTTRSQLIWGLRPPPHPCGAGRVRSLGIPTVLDRLIQQAIAQALTPQYEAVYSDRSYGLLPRRSAHDAIGMMHKEGLAKGKKVQLLQIV